MISFSQIGKAGRLGNQLFQYSILKYISINLNFNIELLNSTLENTHHGQKCLLNNFKLKSCKFVDKIYFEHSFIEDGFFQNINNREFDENILKINDNTDLLGYFQNPNYYQSIKKELLQEFEIQDSIKYKINNLIKDIRNPIASLHVRRGDLSDNKDSIDYDWSNNFSQNSLQFKYYSKALELIPNDCKILLFTGGSRSNNNQNDYEWCEKHFVDKRIISINGLTDIETFYLMSICQYNITSFASTFSWWASFLNKNNNIIAPKIYYPSVPISPEKVYPNDWNLIDI